MNEKLLKVSASQIQFPLQSCEKPQGRGDMHLRVIDAREVASYTSEKKYRKDKNSKYRSKRDSR